MMYRAFLSHSSVDKEFVRSVANELGRQFCLFDEQVFEDGHQFKVAIENALDDASVFVLFVGEYALSRMWVDFEIEEAWYRKLERKISSSLVYILSPSIEFNKLPRWLSRAKISYASAPKPTARGIRHHLDEMLRAQQQTHFEGRSAEIASLQKMLTPLGQPAPRFIGVYGLPSVGRRTFIKKAVHLSLHYPKVIEVSVSESDGLSDITIKLANLLEPFSTKDGFDAIVESIRGQSEEELLSRNVANLRAANGHKELPVFFDDGGLLTPDGSLSEPIQKLISRIVGDNDIYVFFVSTRRLPAVVPSIHINPLAEEDVQRLISKIAAAESVNLTVSQVREIAEYVNGHPPCAYYAVDQVKAYGVQSVIMDKSRLVQFRTSAFVKFLKDRHLTSVQNSILLLLARYSPVPVQLLSKVLNLSASALIENVVSLIDHSLVTPDSSGLYAIASPVSEAVLAQFRDDSETNHELVYNALQDILNSKEEELPRLQLYRQLLKAALRSGSHKEDIFHLTSDLINFAEDFYHRGEYRQCIETARLAVKESPKSVNGRDFLIRGLIQESEWGEAVAELENFKKYAPIRDYHFLSGFYYRKCGRLKVAIDEFKAAERHGRRGTSLFREIANCYFLLSDLPSAKKYVDTGLSIREDRYLLDLKIQIAVADNQERAAREGLVKLEVMDSESFVWHRLSTVELRFGSVLEALHAAEKAVETVDRRPPFGMLAQLATCQIRAQLYPDADKTLQKLGRIYKDQKSDIRFGLECRLEIERGRYDKAMTLYEKIKDISAPVYKAMRRDYLRGLLKSALNDQDRRRYNDDLAGLERQLEDFDQETAWIKFMQ